MTATSEMLNPQMPPVPPEWVDERERKPAVGQPVIISVMRKAVRTDDGQGGTKWVLQQPDEPIDLEKDTVYWLPDQV